MSSKYSCIKNEFTKRSAYIQFFKTPPTEKVSLLYKKIRQNVLTVQKWKGSKTTDISKTK